MGMFAAVKKAALTAVMSAGRLIGAKGVWNQYTHASPRNEEDLLRLFGTNARLGSPVDAISTDVSVVQWVLKRKVKKKGRVRLELVHEHPVLDFLARPHPRLPFCAWLWVLTAIKLISGKAPIWVQQKSPMGIPQILRPVAPNNIIGQRPFVDEVSGKAVWKVRVDGTVEDIPYEDLLWPYRPNPLDPLGWGIGKASGIDDELYCDEAMVKFNDLYFKNGAHLGALVNVPGADLEELGKEWKTDRVGVTNAHRPLLTNSEQPAQIIHLTPPMKDLAYSEGRKLGRDFILQAFACSPERAGILENSNRSTIDASDYHNQKYCTLPELIYWRNFFNNELLPKWGEPDLYLDFVNPVKETAEERLALAQAGFGGGWLTVNEARELHNYEPIEGGECLAIPINNVILLDVKNGLKIPEGMAQMALARLGSGNSPSPALNPPKPAKSRRQA